MSAPMLPDALERARVTADLDRSMVVVAGPGTGKTTALVARVMALVRSGAATPGEVAVITFTEAAAAELRGRLHAALAATSAPGSDTSSAADDADLVTVCTLHALAARILGEHALSAGVPPGFEVLDAAADRADFEASLGSLLDEMLDDPAAEAMLLRGFVLGLDDRAVADVAWALRSEWDRLPAAMEAIEAARPEPGAWRQCDLGPVLGALDRAMAMSRWCTDDDDLLLLHLRDRLPEARRALVAAADDEQAVLPLLVRLSSFACGFGRAEHWGGRVGEVRAACAAAEQARQDVLADARAPVVSELLDRLARTTLDDAARRAGEGRLTFHDLLVHARQLLSSDEQARAALRQRYRRLLVDECQDTDPLQLEVAGWLASAVEGAGDLSRTRPGALFVVGDPRQSIYRFRRAEVGLFDDMCTAIGDRVELSANFRSVPGVLSFVDTVFAELFPAGGGLGQAAHGSLLPVRAPHPTGTRAGNALQLHLPGLGAPADGAPLLELPPVVVLGGPSEATVGEVRRAAARDVAAALQRAVAEGWPVADGDGPARPVRWRDVAVLIPARSALAPLEEAFEEAGVAYRLEGAALLWGSDDVRDVLSALAAVADPSDTVAVLAALRSPGIGCGDDDLLSWRRAGGSFDPLGSTPEGNEEHPVAHGLGLIAGLHERRLWCEPSELVRLAVAELRCIEIAFAHRRPRDHWHRLRWLEDQARAFDESHGGTLGDFLEWAEIQRQGEGRAPVLGPPEEDDDAVRIMTVHGAKGLEFPVAVVAGIERDDTGAHRPSAVLWTEGPVPEVRAGPALRSRGYDAAADAERALERAEQVRLLYVAMTRAKDHLVVCLHHRERNGAADPGPAARLLEICRAHPLLWRRVPGAEDDRRRETRTARAVAAASRVFGIDASRGADEARAASEWAAQLARFEEERARLLETLGASRALAPASAGHIGDRVAAAVDRAVHDALATIDLGAGREEDRSASESCAAHATAHGVSEHLEEIAALVDAARASDVVQWAASRRHHRDVEVCAPMGDGLFHGRVDLVVEDGSDLVLVAYETEGHSGEVPPGTEDGHRAVELGACALALEAATGRPVVRSVLLLLGRQGPRQQVVEGAELDDAKADALRSSPATGSGAPAEGHEQPSR